MYPEDLRLIEDAIAAGKFDKTRRAHYERLMSRDPAATRRLLASLEPAGFNLDVWAPFETNTLTWDRSSVGTRGPRAAPPPPSAPDNGALPDEWIYGRRMVRRATSTT